MAKVILSIACVKNSVHGGGSTPLHAEIYPPPDQEQRLPWSDTPFWSDTSLVRHPPPRPGADPPWSDTPSGQTPPGQTHPPDQEHTPLVRHPISGQTPPPHPWTRSRRLLLQPVRILLERILVFTIFSYVDKCSYHTFFNLRD